MKRSTQIGCRSETKRTKFLKIDHIIIGCKDIEDSKRFYEEILGFNPIEEFVDTGTGNKGIILKSTDSVYELKILLVPFSSERLPNPQHIAFEIEEKKFKNILKNANSIGLKIRSKPTLDCTEFGIGEMKSEKEMYKIFYLLDPSGVNLEFLTCYH